jgi:arginine-tRNA-protein transferase
MSAITTGLSRHLQFFLSGPTPCPYLPDQVERKLFTRLRGGAEHVNEVNSYLMRAGFRRSHDIVYRPACAHCNACVPVRIPVRLFNPSRSLRRIMRRNADLQLEVMPSRMTDENYALFLAYQAARHPDSDMAHMTRLDFRAMLQDSVVDAQLYQLRGPQQDLLASIMTDRVSDGLSAVYSFFAPQAEKRSLGIQLILALIEQARQANLPYVYLGYWISGSRKMNYKNRFQPLQALTSQGWSWLEQDKA